MVCPLRDFCKGRCRHIRRIKRCLYKTKILTGHYRPALPLFYISLQVNNLWRVYQCVIYYYIVPIMLYMSSVYTPRLKSLCILFFSAFLMLFSGIAMAQKPQNSDKKEGSDAKQGNAPANADGQRPGGGGMGNGRGFNSAQFYIGRFYGKVVDESTGKGIAYASVQISGMKFDTIAKTMKPAVFGGQLTEENGDFSIEGLPIRGEMTLKINYLGYANIEQKVSFGKMERGANGGGNFGQGAGAMEKDLGNIKLAATSQLLKEVEIRGEAAQVTLALDKKVYRVDKDAVAAGGTAEDALKNVPSVQVDLDGNISLRNAAPQIFVDGRPTTLSMDQIPADAIESIEVITNPSAKYDASGGNAGILNVVLKKDRRLGYNGNIRTGVDMRGRVNLGGDLNVRDRKTNVFLGGNFNQRKSLSTSETDRYNLFGSPKTNVFQNSDSKNLGFFAMGRGGVDWFINNRSTLTFSGNYHGGTFNSGDNLTIQTDTLRATTITTNTLRISDNERVFKNLGSQLLYKYLFPKEGRELTADINYNLSNSNNTGTFNTTYVGRSFLTRQQQTGTGSNQFITFQTDYTTPLKSPGLKLELGARAAVRDYDADNGSYEYNFGDAEFVRVPNFADRYAFQDRLFAAYSTLSKSYPKFGYQFGLRAERWQYEGKLPDQNVTFKNQSNTVLDHLFPSAFFTYKLNEDDNLQFNFSRRVNRPNFFQLIPFPDFSDSLLLSRGNPDLKPEYTNSTELSYQNIFNKKHNLLVSVYYKLATDLITRYQFTEEIAGRQAIVSTYANANQSTAYGTEITLRNNFWKFLEVTTNVNLYNSIVKAGNVEANLEVQQFTWFVKENVLFRLPKNFNIQLNGSYQSRTAFGVDGGGRGGGGGGRGGGGGGGWGGGPSNTAQGYTIPVWYVDWSIRKDLWKRKGSISLSMQDLFRSRRQGSHTESPLIFVQDTWRRRDPQFMRLNFSYRFGKMDTSLFRRKNNRTESEGMEGF